MVRREKRLTFQSGAQPRFRHRRGHVGSTPNPDTAMLSNVIRTLPPEMDPNQTYILSGPFVNYDPSLQTYVNVFSARPIPSGMTVIATPCPPPSSNSSGKRRSSAHPKSGSSPAQAQSDASSQFNPDALPFVPKEPESPIGSSVTHGDLDSEIGSRVEEAGLGKHHSLSADRRSPCFMYWSSAYPEGTLVPLRQPQPPVYFQTTN